MHRQLRLISLTAALLTGLIACRDPGTPLIPSDDPEANQLKFSQVKGTEAKTGDFKAELVTSALALAPTQDFLSINVAPGLTDQTRLLTVTLRAPSNQIKAGASFPFSRNSALGSATGLYQESVSIVVNQAFQATAGSLVIDKIAGTTNLTVEFHIKDALMEPAQTSNGVLGKGSFMLNLHGLPTR